MDDFFRIGTFAGMSLIDKKLLEKAMEAVGIKPAPLALAIGRDKDFVRDYLTGRKRTLKLDDAQAIAGELGVSLSSLTAGRTDDLDAGGMEVAGKVAAGLYRDITVENQDTERQKIAFAKDMRYAHARQYALEVEGDSMNQVVPEGAFVICVNYIDSGINLINGMIVHVEKSVMGGQFVEATLKEVHREGKGAIMLVPRSSNPSHKPFSATGASGDEVEIRGIVIGKFEPFKLPH